MTQQTSKGKYSRELADLICDFLHQRQFPVAVIYGNPETGKSDTACLIAEIGLNEKELDCYASNMKTELGQRITSLEDVKFWHRNQIGKKLYILDEAGINDDARNPFSKLNRQIRHEIFIARKFFVHWIFILQEIKDIDTWKNSNLTGLIIKKKASDGTFKALLDFKWFEDQIPVIPFPKTTIPFDTLDVAPFTLEKQTEDIHVSLQGEAADIARMLKRLHNSDAVAKEMEKLTGQRWTRKDVMNKLYQFLEHLEF
jgi:hypothetical protein